MKALQGKVAIITGAARGQGAAEARLFAENGASLVLTDINPAGEEVVDLLGDRAKFLIHDVSDQAGWKEVVRETVATFGKVDILVNNAGLFEPATFDNTDEALIMRLIAANQVGPFLGMLTTAPAMRDNGGGSIVNISSVCGVRGWARQSAYASTKWALRGLSKCAASDLGSSAIRVNAILPGMVDTPMLDRNTPEQMEGFKALIPLGRIATPLDIAKAALFLASDESAYITGAEIIVDGGISL